MKLLVQKATTDVSVYLFIQNSSVTTGAGLTGLVYNSASLVAYYVRPLGSATAITLATQTVTGAHSDGGFVEVDATNMPGVYRLDLPDAVCATGVNSVVVMLKGATNMAPVLLEIQLSSFNPNDSVRLGLTALPNAAADAAGGLPISDAGGLDLDAQIGTKINDILTDTGTTLQGELDGIQADTEDIQTRLPAALVSGRIDASVGAMAANTITAAATAADYITEVQTAITGGAYDLDTDANGRIRIVDGTGAGEINTISGVVEARLANDVSHGGNNAQLWLQSTGLVSPLTIKCTNFGSGIGPAISLDVDTGECIRLYGGSALTTGVVFEVGSKAVSCTSTGVTSDVQGTWNAAWDAEVQSECEDALAAYGASTLDAAGIRTAVGLASANLDTQLDALPTAAENAAALMDLSNGVETGVTPRQALRFIAAALAGELSGAATTTVTIKAANNNGTTRITATVDADGNRTALTLNGS